MAKDATVQSLQQLVKNLETIALEGGATSVKQIEPRDIVVAQWVRVKCQFGCQYYGKRFTCPPYSPTPEDTSATLQSYQNALLVEFANLDIERIRVEPARSMIQNVLYNMERTAFLNGYERAFSYKAGPCNLCKECKAEKLENPNIFCQKECRNPKEARPSMEAVGIDVYSTVHRAGYELNVVRDKSQIFKQFGLVLLE